MTEHGDDLTLADAQVDAEENVAVRTPRAARRRRAAAGASSLDRRCAAKVGLHELGGAHQGIDIADGDDAPILEEVGRAAQATDHVPVVARRPGAEKILDIECSPS